VSRAMRGERFPRPLPRLRPGAAEVDGDVDEFDGAVGGELADYGDHGDQAPSLDQDAVLGRPANCSGGPSQPVANSSTMASNS
jgi:hypothetical protein